MNNKTNKEWKQRKGRNLPEQKSWCADKTRDRQRPGDKAKCTSMSVFNQETQEKEKKNVKHAAHASMHARVSGQTLNGFR